MDIPLSKSLARQHTTTSNDKGSRFRNGRLDFLYNTLVGQHSYHCFIFCYQQIALPTGC